MKCKSCGTQFIPERPDVHVCQPCIDLVVYRAIFNPTDIAPDSVDTHLIAALAKLAIMEKALESIYMFGQGRTLTQGACIAHAALTEARALDGKKG